MTHADMQLCSLEGELQTFLLKHTLLPARANVLVEPAAFALNKHMNLTAAMALSEPVSIVPQLALPTRSAFHNISIVGTLITQLAGWLARWLLS